MTDAVVIPFPKVARNGQERLRESLENLQSALHQQKRALSDWRFAMTELGIGVAGLSQALGSYQDSLSDVELRLTGLRIETRRLQDWAGFALADDPAPARATPATAQAAG